MNIIEIILILIITAIVYILIENIKYFYIRKFIWLAIFTSNIIEYNMFTFFWVIGVMGVLMNLHEIYKKVVDKN